MKRCMQCGRNLSPSEFRSSVGRVTVRCSECRANINHYQSRKRRQRIYAPDKPLKIIRCSRCSERTVARSADAPTLHMWRGVDFAGGRGVCPNH